jgi:hypothetical protein
MRTLAITITWLMMIMMMIWRSDWPRNTEIYMPRNLSKNDFKSLNEYFGEVLDTSRQRNSD